MKPAWFDYYAPRSLDEALRILADAGPNGRVLAGGQSLMPMLNCRLLNPDVLVDINRIDALNYTMFHDDGQHVKGLQDADVVLVGVSRTSKTPTSIYLANRGIKTGNVPLVPGVPVAAEVEKLTRPLVVGLYASPERIVQIRENRLLGLKAHRDDDRYIDKTAVAEEVAFSRRLCAKYSWPSIDVTRRSIEETAAAVMKLLAERRRRPVT